MLEDAGVRWAFGVPSGPVLPLIEAMRNSRVEEVHSPALRDEEAIVPQASEVEDGQRTETCAEPAEET
jgi:hypothetical protein